MSNMEIVLNGNNYTEQQALTMKAEIQAYATANNLKGLVSIIEPL